MASCWVSDDLSTRHDLLVVSKWSGLCSESTEPLPPRQQQSFWGMIYIQSSRAKYPKWLHRLARQSCSQEANHGGIRTVLATVSTLSCWILPITTFTHYFLCSIIDYLAASSPFPISPNTLTPFLPSAVPTPTAAAPTARILL